MSQHYCGRQIGDVRILPILFNTEMVRAILEDRKDVTRRVVKDYDKYERLLGIELKFPRQVYKAFKRPYIPGDVLYVRETWFKDTGRFMYRADYSDTEKFYIDGKEIKIRWRPSIHMPKEAARIFLRVTDVRAERLQNISFEDARREGVKPRGNAAGCRFCAEPPYFPECDYDHCDNYKGLLGQRYLLPFIDLWDSTVNPENRQRYGWDANPWVWRTEFERCEKPEGFDG